MHST